MQAPPQVKTWGNYLLIISHQGGIVKQDNRGPHTPQIIPGYRDYLSKLLHVLAEISEYCPSQQTRQPDYCPSQQTILPVSAETSDYFTSQQKPLTTDRLSRNL